MELLHVRTPPRVRVRATVKLSAAFFRDESSITIGGGGGNESAIAPKKCEKKPYCLSRESDCLSYYYQKQIPSEALLNNWWTEANNETNLLQILLSQAVDACFADLPRAAYSTLRPYATTVSKKNQRHTPLRIKSKTQ